MSDKETIKAIRNLGVNDKAARVYLANLALGETTILELAKKSGVSRTSIYYTIEELKEKGMITEVERGKKSYYMYVEPDHVVREIRQNILTIDEVLPTLEEIKWSGKRKPRVEFYFAPAGFKEVWWKLLHSGCNEFLITTDAKHFGGYVKEKYILDEIIAEKNKKNIKSRQLIIDSPLARSIMMKDEKENRKTKLLNKDHLLHYTEIIAPAFVAYISPRSENVMFTIDQPSFADTRRSMFEILWGEL